MADFEELKKGMEFSRAFKITDAAIDAYAELTGDRNPMHMDAECARSAGFRGRIAHGMYLAGLLSRMVGEDAPGHGAIWFAQDLSFEEPAYVGDVITITVRIVQVSPATRTVSIDVRAEDENRNLKFRGKGKVTMPQTQKKREKTVNKRTALVTGGSGGIGSAVCLGLARQDMHVLVGFHHDEKAAVEICAAISKAGGKADPVALAMEDYSGLRTTAAKLLARHGVIDTVVCCAMQSWRRAGFTELQAKDIEEDFGMAVVGNAVLLQALLPEMVAQRFGRIAGIASSVVQGIPPAQQVSYVTAKYGMVGLFKSLMAEYSGTGVTFNLVSPSLVDTAFTKSIPDRTRRAMAIQSPMGRLCTPQDVADVVGLLVARESYINGANIPVSGGL